MASDPRARNDPEPLAVDVLLGRIAREAGDAQPRLIETHISWVLLAGEHAYKIRRPVRMPFVDFTAPEARRADCERELALNRRWAPSLYLSVVPVRGPRDDPSLDGDGPTVEHAVKMRRFPDEARLDRVAACGGLDAARIDELAATVAALHDAAPRAREEETACAVSASGASGGWRPCSAPACARASCASATATCTSRTSPWSTGA